MFEFLCALSFRVGINNSRSLLRKFSRNEKHVIALLFSNKEFNTLKTCVIARVPDINWPSADERARCNGIWLRESETYQYDTALHANTKELDGAQTNGRDGIWPSTAKKCWWRPKTLIAHLRARTRTYSCVDKVFEFFFVLKVSRLENWFPLKIAVIQDYQQRQCVRKVHFSWFTLHRPWLFLCVRLAGSRFCFVMLYFLRRPIIQGWLTRYGST